jgi:hypothetical protein
VNANLVSPAVQPVVFGELFAFGGIVLILSGVLFARHDDTSPSVRSLPSEFRRERASTAVFSPRAVMDGHGVEPN